MDFELLMMMLLQTLAIDSVASAPAAVEATTQSELPPDFQTAEFLMKHGMIDAIVSRLEMKSRLSTYLDFMMAGRRAA